MSDLISKSAAQAIPPLPKCYREYETSNLDDAYDKGWEDALFSLNALPTFEPPMTSGYVEIVADLPPVEYAPVVRCKDCKWWGLSSHNTLGIHICKKYNGVRFDSDYCSRAERSEDGEIH